MVSSGGSVDFEDDFHPDSQRSTGGGGAASAHSNQNDAVAIMDLSDSLMRLTSQEKQTPKEGTGSNTTQ